MSYQVVGFGENHFGEAMLGRQETSNLEEELAWCSPVLAVVKWMKNYKRI